MHLINRTFYILTAALLITPLSANADSWSCSHGNNVREVHIERPTSSPAPCNVVYKKQTEGFEDQTLWSASSDDSYCEEKAEAFVAKLESWGWVCTETISDETETDSESEETADDTTATETGTDNQGETTTDTTP